MAKRLALILGIVFIAVGILGFVVPNLMGTHLSSAHNLIHLVSGGLALYFGTAGSLSGAKSFCIIFGIVYLGLGLAGFAFGTDMSSTLTPPGIHGHDSHLLRVIPGILELGLHDHLLHVALGLIFILGGVFTRANVAVMKRSVSSSEVYHH